MTDAKTKATARAFDDAFSALLETRSFYADINRLSDWYSAVLTLARGVAPYEAHMADGMLSKVEYRESYPLQYQHGYDSLRRICDRTELALLTERDREVLIYRRLAGCSEYEIQRWCGLWASEERLEQAGQDYEGDLAG